MSAVTQFLADNKEWFYPSLAAIAAAAGWLIKLAATRSKANAEIAKNISQHTQVNVTNNIGNHPVRADESLPGTTPAVAAGDLHKGRLGRGQGEYC